MVQQRVLETAKGQFLFRVTEDGRDFLLQEGTDQRYGARHLKRAIERHVVYPMANLLATEQVRLGDVLRIDWDPVGTCLTFEREGEGAVIARPTTATRVAAAYAGRASGGRALELPIPSVAREVQAPAGASPVAPAPAPTNRRKTDNI
jgi:hypothetical protein